MKRKIIFSVMCVLLFLFPILGVIGATNTLPLTPEFSFGGVTANFYSVDYDLNHPLISSNKRLDMGYIDGITAEKDFAYINLASGYTVLESDSYFTQIQSNTFINTTWDSSATAGATVKSVTDLSSGSKSTIASANAITNATGGTGYWSNNLWYDYDDDNVVDSNEKWYTQIDHQAILFVNYKSWHNASDATAYWQIAFIFETTGSDYSIIVKHAYTSGDSGWSDLDSSAENQATLTYYDANGTTIATILPVDEILDADLGDDPDLKGLKSTKITFFGGADKQHNIEIYNMAVFTQKPAFSDRLDDDIDWDIDASAIFSTFVWDDTDFLVTKVTEGTTESYDNTIDLKASVEDGATPLVKFRKLQLGGVFSMPPTTYSMSSSAISGGYKTTMDMWFKTTGLYTYFSDTTTSNYFSWSTCQFNVTLGDDVLIGSYTGFENQIVSFYVDGVDKTTAFDDVWDVSSDDTEVQYDISDPNTSTGSQQQVKLIFNSRSSYSGSGGAGVTTSDNTLLLVFIVGAVLLIAGIVVYKATRKKKKGKKKKAWYKVW